MSQFSRRSFLKKSATASAAIASVPYWSRSNESVAAAFQDRMKIGCIGMGGMGTGDKLLRADKAARICAILAFNCAI